MINIDVIDGAKQPDLFDTQKYLARTALDAWAYVIHIGYRREALIRAKHGGSKEAGEMLELLRKKKKLWKYFSEMAGCNMHLLVHEAWANGLLPQETLKKAEQIPIMRVCYAPIN